MNPKLPDHGGVHVEKGARALTSVCVSHYAEGTASDYKHPEQKRGIYDFCLTANAFRRMRNSKWRY